MAFFGLNMKAVIVGNIKKLNRGLNGIKRECILHIPFFIYLQVKNAQVY